MIKKEQRQDDFFNQPVVADPNNNGGGTGAKEPKNCCLINNIIHKSINRYTCPDEVNITGIAEGFIEHNERQSEFFGCILISSCLILKSNIF